MSILKLIFLVVVTCCPALLCAADSGRLERITANPGNHWAVSPNGRFVAYERYRYNPVTPTPPGVTNTPNTIGYVLDRQLQIFRTIERSALPSGLEYLLRAISNDGNHLAIQLQGLLVTFDPPPPPTYDGFDLVWFDLQLGTMERISTGTQPLEVINTERKSNAFNPPYSLLDDRDKRLSAHATRCAFVGRRLAAPPSYNIEPNEQIYFRVQSAPYSLLLSSNTDGQSGNGDSKHPIMSADGQHVVFFSESSDLVSGDTNLKPDVFVVNVNSRAIERVSLRMDGSQHEGQLGEYSISADARFVTYSLWDHINWTLSTIIYDRLRNQRRLLASAVGQGLGIVISYVPNFRLSPQAPFLWAEGGDQLAHQYYVYMVDPETGTYNRTSSDRLGNPANAMVYRSYVSNGQIRYDNFYSGYALSNNGEWMAFKSNTPNLHIDHAFDPESSRYTSLYMRKLPQAGEVHLDSFE